ncbi:tyrosine-type recombinase/integrase [Streptomyces sp. NPDC001222]|uniref:tyrosine-type recombinase/integrase n=1 Tax=unclassified Streptomyces TaxID=2593676 RepID=UPI0030D41316
MAAWLDSEGIGEGTPFLIAPDGSYDIELNGYWTSTQMIGGSRHTRSGSAREMRTFCDFLWNHRPPVADGTEGTESAAPGRARGWRDATVRDREVYEFWRCDDPQGSRLIGSSWNHAVSMAYGFYRWAGKRKYTASNPIDERACRRRAGESRRRPRRGEEAGKTAAEKRPDARRKKVVWLTPEQYRSWRDVGIRGYLPTGLKDPSFRGKRIARNSAYTDLMVRTGLRLEEQSALTLFELPDHDGLSAYYRFWLPEAIAKGGSCRDVYIPDGGLRAIVDYVEIDRADAVARAQAAGRYEAVEDKLVVEPGTTRVRIGDKWHLVEDLDPEERLRLFTTTERGLEPAALWLSEDGTPLTLHAWKWVFREASKRCRLLGVKIHGHPHALRHSFAVVTLEQLQRAHLESLSAMDMVQRRHYRMIWGDPLDWVRIRLGHASLETTQNYLHTLRELEMETRLMLVPDLWEHPDRPYLDDMAKAVEAEECRTIEDAWDEDSFLAEEWV